MVDMVVIVMEEVKQTPSCDRVLDFVIYLQSRAQSGGLIRIPIVTKKNVKFDTN